MALSAATVLEVQQGGNDTNGGGFVTGASGTDFSLIATKRPNGGTNGSSVVAVANGTTTIVCADAQFTAAIVGNIVFFSGGTGAIAGVWKQVTVFTNATTVTIDSLIAASTGMTINIGGALASPGTASLVATVSGQKVFIKFNATSYSITSATQVSGGVVIGAVGVIFCGYDINRVLTNVDANRPTLLASGIASVTLARSLGTGGQLINLIADGATLTGIIGFSGSLGALNYRCHAQNCPSGGFFSSNVVSYQLCTATLNGTAGFSVTGFVYMCEAYSNSGVPGFSSNITPINCVNCIASTNGSGFSTANRGSSYTKCISYANTGDGFTGGNFYTAYACISEANGGWGFNIGSASVLLLDCATFNNTSGAFNGATNPINTTILNTTGTFFVNAAGGNFALNNLVNQGLLLRAAATSMNVFIKSTATIGFSDIGPVQHQDIPSVVNNIFVIDD